MKKIYSNRREKTLESFIGKNVWVRVRKCSNNRCGYIKILSNKDNFIRCCYISDEIISASNHYKWMKERVFKDRYNSFLDLYMLLDPTHVFTDEEMKELLGI